MIVLQITNRNVYRTVSSLVVKKLRTWGRFMTGKFEMVAIIRQYHYYSLNRKDQK